MSAFIWIAAVALIVLIFFGKSLLDDLDAFYRTFDREHKL